MRCPDFLAMNIFEPLKPPQAPTFATFSEIVAEDATPKESPSRRKTGLFEAYLGDPRALYYELIEDPSRFEDGVMDLVQQLLAGSKRLESLSPEETNLLDRATLSWAEPRHRTTSGETPGGTSSTISPSREPPATYGEALEDPDIELEYREDGKHAPILDADLTGQSLPDFWWQH